MIQDYAGSWQELGGKGASKRACGGKKLPLTVQASTRSLLAFTAFGDGISPTCPTLTIVVKPVDAKSLEGTVDTEGHRFESPEVHAGHADPSAAANGFAAALPASGSGSSTARTIRLERR